jgi:lysophospholipid acyltransferase (LPLAT)-like uncharacterized protein
VASSVAHERRRPARGAALTPRDRLVAALLAGLARGAARLLGRSLRIVERNREPIERLWGAGIPIIYVTWHGRMLMLPYLYGRVRTVYVLASRSRDGELVSRFVRGFGFRVVRGSSSRGAAAALRALARRLIAERAEVAMIPDGPRGPRHVAHPGPVILAKLSGAPIVPLGFGVSRGTILDSWDACLIPHPFARAAVVFGDPIVVPPEADRAALERYRQALEAALCRVTMDADGLAGSPRASRL